MNMIHIEQLRHETATHCMARERLLDRCFGKARHGKTSERLRAGRLPADGLSFVASDETGRLIGTLRLWSVTIGTEARPALLLGPLAVDPLRQGEGLGGRLMQDAITQAKALGHRAVLLVGDAPYYARFGFSAEWTHDLSLPGPVERDRFLGLELIEGGLKGATGLVQPAGEPMPRLLPVAGGEARRLRRAA
jgi:predicted N-acetyltransferase YhbS